MSQRRTSHKRRLFILGAGASYAVGLPDAARVLSHLTLYTQGPYTQVRNRTPMGLFKDVSSALFQFAIQAGFRKGDRFPIDAVAESFYKALQFGPEAFVLLMKFWQALREFVYDRSVVCAEGYRAFIKCLSPGDVVVTFNWDTCLEIELHRQNKALSLSFQPPIAIDHIRVLKPHGSVDFSIAEGYGPSRPQGDFIELVHPALPTLLTHEGVKTPQLYRILTYDLTFAVETSWDEGGLKISWDDKGSKVKSKKRGQTSDESLPSDVGPLHLERFLREAFPFLLTPGTPNNIYAWSYDSIREPLLRIAGEFEAILVSGYSFPSYDGGVIETLATISRSIGRVPVHIVNPSPSSLPKVTLDRIFGKYELHDCGFLDFDWSTVC